MAVQDVISALQTLETQRLKARERRNPTEQAQPSLAEQMGPMRPTAPSAPSATSPPPAVTKAQDVASGTAQGVGMSPMGDPLQAFLGALTGFGRSAASDR